jgi:hypothetical protein
MNNKNRFFLLLLVIGARVDVAPTNIAISVTAMFSITS